ncbi:stage II sporulation protein D [Tumebacillus lipolyticus]|uniref:Stage II sporulation protein D n=1 Tax=Tumebacillus lipolyticus TaxID=1280370 RepID=A0ABW4ZX64_9BACL
MKKNVLPILAVILAVVIVTILIPSGLIALWPEKKQEVTPASTFVELKIEPDDPQIDVYLSEQKKTVSMSLEEYVRGVVAAEMPVQFEREALKAQSIAARTYVVRRLQSGKRTEQGAHVSDDHNQGQAFSTEEKMKKRWGADYQQNLSKLNEAINETREEVALYEGKPIEALFFSTSSGKTENSEDYWENTVPYLRSVDSPWDLNSDKYTATQEMSLADFFQKLGVQAVPAAQVGETIVALERTATEHIKKIKVGDKTFSGADFRSKLGLRSTWFTWQVDRAAGKITFQTKGYGHGVGLSQYGANGMAQEGKTSEQIIRHYYQGVSLGNIADVLTKG